jgi:hypothetical protein
MGTRTRYHGEYSVPIGSSEWRAATSSDQGGGATSNAAAKEARTLRAASASMGSEVMATGNPNNPSDPWTGRVPVERPFAGPLSGVGSAPRGTRTRYHGEYSVPIGTDSPGAGSSTAAAQDAPAAKAKLASATPSPDAADELNLAGKAAMIRELLGLDGDLDISSTIEQANANIGFTAKGNLIEQADALLLELE